MTIDDRNQRLNSEKTPNIPYKYHKLAELS